MISLARPNQLLQPDPAVTLSFHVGRLCRGAAEVQRSAGHSTS